MTISPSLGQRFTLMQLSDSFFPSGSFTLSHGLEALVQQQQIYSIQELKDFLGLILQHKIGTTDVVALRQTHRASVSNNYAELQDIEAQLFAQTLLQQTREIQSKSGRALLMVARSTWQHSHLEQIHSDIQADKMYGLHPIIFAVVGHCSGLDEENTVVAFLHGFLTGLCSSALRLGCVGHINVQRILTEMAPQLASIVQTTKLAKLDDMWSCTPFIDIAQSTHQTLNSKLFAN